MAYLRYLFSATLFVLVFAASINYLIDPAGVYRSGQHGPTAYAEALLQSKYGLWWPDNSLTDWEIKEALSKYSNQADCVVIGSSRVMQIGSARSTRSLNNICTSILNLGVSGASIEAHFILTYLSLQNGQPKKIILGIDPWTFTYGKDPRWYNYAADYQHAKEIILGKSLPVGSDFPDTLGSKLRNLLSLKYTIKSVQRLISNLENGSSQVAAKLAPKLDEKQGGEYPILFSDGSLLYSASSIFSAKENIIPLGGTPYATDGKLNDRAAINSYISLLRWIQSKGTEPILLMTPYHPNVTKAPTSLNALALSTTEPIVRQLGKELGVTVIGTFNPQKAGCLDTEFLDSMHANPDCLARLN